jgi:hypothetical protein
MTVHVCFVPPNAPVREVDIEAWQACEHRRVTRSSLTAAPASFLDASTGEPSCGAFYGPLPPVSLGGLGLRDRIARRKRWVYAAVATPEMWFSLAIVRTGYAATAFAFAYDLQGNRMMLDRTVLGPSGVARVSDDFHQEGEVARFAMGGTKLTVARRGGTLDIHVRIGDLELDAAVDERTGPPAVTAIARLGDGLVNGTEKRALLGVRGRARVGQRVVVLDEGTAGYDYTHGLMPRHTKWRWAFALGKAVAGEPLGFNVAQGFMGEAECAAFYEGKVVPIAEPRFELDVRDPMKPWRLVGDGMDLAFRPGGVHAQHTNLLVVKSRFVQPVGTFRGTLRLAGKDVVVEALPGVVEDQDVLW